MGNFWTESLIAHNEFLQLLQALVVESFSFTRRDEEESEFHLQKSTPSLFRVHKVENRHSHNAIMCVWLQESSERV